MTATPATPVPSAAATPPPPGDGAASSPAADGASFFVTGGTVPRDAPSYVERRADQELYEALLRGEFCYVLTARQMGKSSLIARAAERLGKDGVAVALLDLTAVGQNVTPTQWYKGLLGRLGRQLGIEEELEARWKAGEGLGPLQRWADTVGDVLLSRFDGPIVISIDEIEAVRSLPFSADEFFGAIRECHNRRANDPRYSRLTFCLLGSAAPYELIADPKMTPFNIGKRIELSDFTEEEATPLAYGLTGDEAVLSRVLYWTDGHPYLTQRLCTAAEEVGARHAKDVDRVCEDLFFGSGSRITEDNLLFIQDRLLRADADPAALLTLYGRVRAGKRVTEVEAAALAEALRLAGVAKPDAKGRLHVRNRIYARAFDKRWVREHLPGSELRRQRAAFRRGLSLALAGSAAVTALVGYLALRATRSEGAARQQQRLAERLLFDATLPLAWPAWRDGNVNDARELLDDCRPADRARFEWRYLSRLCDAATRVMPGEAGEAALAAAFTPDGRALVTLAPGDDANDGLGAWDAREWDLGAGAVRLLRRDAGGSRPPPRRPFEAPDSLIGTLSTDGSLAAVAVLGKETVSLVDLRTGRRRLLGGVGPIFKLAFSPDGSLLAVLGYRDRWRLFRAATGTPLATPPLRSPGYQPGDGSRIAALAVSPDGRTLVTGHEGGVVRAWNLKDGRLLWSGRRHDQQIVSLAYSRDGRLLASSSFESPVTVCVWDAKSGAVRSVPEFDSLPIVASALTFSPRGDLLAASWGTAVRVWDTRTGAARATLRGRDESLTAVAFSPDGRLLATAGAAGEGARVWDVAGCVGGRLAEPRVWPPPAPRVGGVLLSGDGHLAAGMAPGRGIYVWDTSTRRVVVSLRVGEGGGQQLSASPAAISPDGRRLAVRRGGGRAPWVYELDREIAVTPVPLSALPSSAWPAGVAQMDRELPAFAPFAGFTTAAFSPDGRTLVTGDILGRVRRWDLAARREVEPLLRGDERRRFGQATIDGLAYSPDGRLLAVARPFTRQDAQRGTFPLVFLYDAASGRLVKTLRERRNRVSLAVFGCRSLSFSPDGSVLAAAGPEAAVRLWRVAPGAPDLPEAQARAGGGAYGLALAFSPDGQTLATSGANDGGVRLWDAATGRQTLVLRHEDGKPVQSLAFTPDGDALISGDERGRIRRWAATTLEAVK